MERKTGYIILMLILVPMFLTASFRSRIYQAYISNTMQDWKAVVDEMETSQANDNEFLAELVNYEYGYIGYCLGIDENKTAEKYLGLAEKNLERLARQGYSPSVIAAYRSAFYGYKIGLSPLKAPFIGPKSVSQAESSIKMDPQNPLGYIQFGNAQFYMPAVFGGSKTEAIKYFQKAEQLMENNPDDWVNENWNYLSLLTLIGQSYEAMQDYKKAETYYRKALNKEPGFSWVKKELLPKIEKTLKNE
jgi:tetratricopeptide (TPR) repeat protein